MLLCGRPVAGDGFVRMNPIEPPIIARPPWRYVRDFLAEPEATALLGWLLSDVVWRTETLVLYGRRHTVPRLVAWAGTPGLDYRYSGIEHRAGGWPAPLAALRGRLREFLPANFVLMNRYRNGADTMGWHADDEPMASDTIASVSLGATRRFLIREREGAPSTRMDLAHGSVLIMNRHLPHSVPRTRKPVGERINLSFRVLP